MTTMDTAPGELSLPYVADLAAKLHEGQFDKGGEAYFSHVQAVALALLPFGAYAVAAGYLHDSIEDTGITAEELAKEHAMPAEVVEAIRFVSRNLYADGVTYMDMIRTVATEGPYIARLVKIADNAHNSRSDRVIPGADAEFLAFSRKRYARARKILYPSVNRNDIVTILEVINPDLLAELG